MRAEEQAAAPQQLVALELTVVKAVMA